MTTLDKIREKRQVHIEKIEGGHQAVRRLMNLGIREGDTIKVIRGSTFGGPMLVNANAAQIAIGKGLASKIYVREIDDESQTP